MIYTVGNQANYLSAIARSEQGYITKLGKEWSGLLNAYPGGCCFLTVEDAQRYIREHGKVGIYAVFGLEADWEADTEPHETGWWHSLMRDAKIVVLAED